METKKETTTAKGATHEHSHTAQPKTIIGTVGYIVSCAYHGQIFSGADMDAANAACTDHWSQFHTPTSLADGIAGAPVPVSHLIIYTVNVASQADFQQHT